LKGIPLISTYASALSAARDAACGQHYPSGALYVVATPIGNLADITLRALHVLNIAQTIACEDTRHTQALLRAYGIDKTASQLLAVHQHNEAEAALSVMDRLRHGRAGGLRQRRRNPRHQRPRRTLGGSGAGAIAAGGSVARGQQRDGCAQRGRYRRGGRAAWRVRFRRFSTCQRPTNELLLYKP
jgi:hypothetical protein